MLMVHVISSPELCKFLTEVNWYLPRKKKKTFGWVFSKTVYELEALLHDCWLITPRKRTHNQYLIGCFFFLFFSDVSAQRYLGTASQDFPDYCFRISYIFKAPLEGEQSERESERIKWPSSKCITNYVGGDKQDSKGCNRLTRRAVPFFFPSPPL